MVALRERRMEEDEGEWEMRIWALSGQRLLGMKGSQPFGGRGEALG